MTISKILEFKGLRAPTVLPNARIADVIAALKAEDVGVLVVSIYDLHIDGIISERDVVRSLHQFGADVLEQPDRSGPPLGIVFIPSEEDQKMAGKQDKPELTLL